MITQYNEILSQVIRNEGGVINIIKDNNNNSNDFILLLKNDLSHKYNIINDISYEQLNNYLKTTIEKTIFFVDITCISNINKKLHNTINNHNRNNTIILISKNVDNLNNLSTYNHLILYASDYILRISNNKINIIKNRYGNEYNKELYIDDIVLKVRKLKLQKISKNIF